MQAFEFTTRSGTRLALFGETTNYSVDAQTGVAERQFLKQSGAVHQWTGAPPRKYTFSCVCVGHGSTPDERTADVERRIRLIADTVLADPFGTLTHPRLGSLDAVVESLTFNENTGEATDAIDYQLRLADDFVKNIPASSPVAAATAAVEKSKQATLGAANAGPVVIGHAQTLETACSAILSASTYQAGSCGGECLHGFRGTDPLVLVAACAYLSTTCVPIRPASLRSRRRRDADNHCLQCAESHVAVSSRCHGLRWRQPGSRRADPGP